MRARLARMGARGQSANPVLEPLFRSVRASHPKADLALLERAYQTAEKMHGTQTRKSGDPYITHPLAVTTILADIGMTEPTLAAALLHDTVEDTPYTLDQVRADFGDEVGPLQHRHVGLRVVHPHRAEQRLEDRVAGLALGGHPRQARSHPPS